jgi:hypothetical protein
MEITMKSRTWMSVAALLLPLSACSFGRVGDRARIGCPEGELCSEEISGLYFDGAATFATAATRPIRLLQSNGSFAFGFQGPFIAEVEGGTALAIREKGKDFVVVHAREPGVARLAIRDPKTKALFDSTEIAVADPAALAVTAAPLTTGSRFALATESSYRLRVDLVAEDGRSLADDVDLTVRGLGAEARQEGSAIVLRTTAQTGSATIIGVPSNLAELTTSVDVVDVAPDSTIEAIAAATPAHSKFPKPILATKPAQSVRPLARRRGPADLPNVPPMAISEAHAFAHRVCPALARGVRSAERLHRRRVHSVAGRALHRTGGRVLPWQHARSGRVERHGQARALLRFHAPVRRWHPSPAAAATSLICAIS